MSKVAVVYWSGTGNTEQMANFVLEGAKSAGAEAELFPCDAFDSDLVDGFDGIAFGCSAQGDEVIEESEFEPMFSSCEPKLQGKRVALFGSYGWGDGEWMRSWESRCADSGITLAAESVIANDAPDDDAADKCRALGAAIA
ncbi:MAG: flavodoxin [Oscillospiraceae bacterium]|nr:flavodoxin [Oscillospiraceae bacterium]